MNPVETLIELRSGDVWFGAALGFIGGAIGGFLPWPIAGLLCGGPVSLALGCLIFSLSRRRLSLEAVGGWALFFAMIFLGNET